MKTLKKFLLVVIVIVTTLDFTACDSDSDGNGILSDSSLIGTWQTTSKERGDNWYWEETSTITFRKDGTGRTISKWHEVYDGDDDEGMDISNFEYTYKEDILTIIEENEDGELEISKLEVISLTSSRLVLMNEDGDIFTFSKVD